ncbi:RNA polymerase sigma factor [Paraburkholderia agricolaris]|uniref:RNA polymerase sigma factor n=1 Tax=Paraburkholderia agricolaris TaxID=2152888 RepID=UPI001FECFC42|nr:RNA polymerase sigma factor [Paraburkholderia agricolaris]
MILTTGIEIMATLAERDTTTCTLPVCMRGSDNREQVFCDLVREHRRRLYYFVLRRIGSAVDAEDITQEAFVEAADAYGSWRGDSRLSTWLYGIAMNLVRNHLNRCPERRYRFESDDESLFEAHECESVENAFERKQTVNVLIEEMGGLPVEMREILMMVGVQQMSYEEISVVLGIPIGTVRSRLSRARSTLRRKLSAVGWEHA